MPTEREESPVVNNFVGFRCVFFVQCHRDSLQIQSKCNAERFEYTEVKISFDKVVFKVLFG